MVYAGVYGCSSCGEEAPRDLLTVKKVLYLEMGERPKTLRSRVVAWLCPECVAQDEPWLAMPYSSPGMPGGYTPRAPGDWVNTERGAAILAAEESYGSQ